MVCDKHEHAGLQISISGLSPQGAKFFFPIGSKPFGKDFSAEAYFEMVQSVIFQKFIPKNIKRIEAFDGNAYLHRDFDFPADMSHEEEHLKLEREMTRISEFARRMVEKGTLKLGCDFVKDILPKLGSSKTFWYDFKLKSSVESTRMVSQLPDVLLKLFVETLMRSTFVKFVTNQNGVTHLIIKKIVLFPGGDVLVTKSD